jgi:predicted nucleotidyltransferase component of viral defense system
LNVLDPRLVEDAANRLDTDEGLVEKDWHVVRAISVIAMLDHGGMQPAFSGGTSLSAAWGLIKRFSEDIDFKVATPVASSTSQARVHRRRYRERVLAALNAADFAATRPLWPAPTTMMSKLS